MKRVFLSYLSYLSYSALLFLPINALAALCVENNTLKCDDLGYTETSCKYGGVACPFDVSRWYCAEWTCEDGRYFSSPQDGMECVDVVYKDLNCFDCAQTDLCSAYDEKSLNQTLDCADCSVITVLNDITITDKLPDLKEGQTLKAAGGQTYTITVNPSGDIQSTDPEITIEGQSVKLSELMGGDMGLGVILTTADGSKIENIHFEAAATHNMDAVVLTLGDTTFNNLSVVIDGENEENERVLTAGVLSINPSGHLSFKGDTYIEMKDLKGRQMVGGIWDFMAILGIPDTSYFTTVTADNIDIRQENISGEDGGLIGLVLGNLDVSDNVTITQNNNNSEQLYGVNGITVTIGGDVEVVQNNNNGNITGFYIDNNATIGSSVEITQNNSSDSLYGMSGGRIVMTKADTKIIINQSNNGASYGLSSSVKALTDGVEIIINQDNISASSRGVYTMSKDNISIENAALTINQTASATVYGIDASSIRFIGDLPVTINQNNNSKGKIYGINGNVTSDGKAVLTINQTNNIVRGDLRGIYGKPTFADIRIVQENNTKDKSLSNPTYNITAIDTGELRSDNIDIRQIGNDFGGNLTGIYSNDSLAGVIKIEQKDNTNDLGSITSYPTVYGIVASGNFSADNVEIIQSGYNHYQNSNTLHIEGFWKAANGEAVHVGDISVTQTDWNISYNSSADSYIFGINGGNYDNAVVTQNNIVFEHPTLSTKLCPYRLSALATYTTNGRLSVANSTIINQGQYANDENMCQYVIYGGIDLNQLTANRQCGDLTYNSNYSVVDLTDNYTPCE